MPFRRVFANVLVAALVWCADRWTKLWALRCLTENHTVDIWGSWFGWTLHRNTGAAFGLGARSPQFLILFASALTAGLAVWWLRSVRSSGRAVESFALALIVGGSAGNLTDRFLGGSVIDFIDFKVWPIFNCADIAISTGALLWAVCVIAGRGRSGR